MEPIELLLALEEPASQIRGGINALGIMTTGLYMAKDPYADGFHAVWNYLVDAEQNLHEQLSHIKYTK